MSEFFEVFKKEWREVVRTKKIFLFIGIAIAIVAFSFLVLGVMSLLMNMPDIDLTPDVKAVFSLTFANATGYFITMLSTYFVVFLIIVLRNYMSKEVKEKKWILPLESGIKPQNLLIARMLVITLTIIISTLSACILHFILSLILCKPDVIYTPNGAELLKQTLTKGQSIANVIASYAKIMVYLVLITILILGLNWATKRPAVVVGIMLLLVIVLETILASITVTINGTPTTLESFTPFLFAMIIMPGTVVHWSCYLSASLTTVLIIAGMISYSLFAVKIKGEVIK